LDFGALKKEKNVFFSILILETFFFENNNGIKVCKYHEFEFEDCSKRNIDEKGSKSVKPDPFKTI
jgi:hypothetical protein